MSDADVPESAESAEVAALRAQLEASLAAGAVPNGWQRRVQWSADGGSLHLPSTGLFIVAATVICGLAWGWGAGLAAVIASVGVRVLLSVRGGPRPGQTITESFIPPDETLLELGIAGHQAFGVTRSRPEFSVTREATPADRRSARRVTALVGAAFAALGALGLLLESRAMSPETFLRTVSLVEAAACAVFAVWAWRLYGRLVPVTGPASPAWETDSGNDVLATATTGTTTESVGSALLSRLPLKVNRVLVPFLILAYGALSVLAGFHLTPVPGQVWSGLGAATELVVFVVAGIRGVVLAIASVFQRDWAGLRSAVWMALLMALLLLVAKLFGWLDDWDALISSVRGQVG
jgi:hypothetical protein